MKSEKEGSGARGLRPGATVSTNEVMLVLVVAVAALLRFLRLGDQLWFDEIWMLIDFVRRPLGECLTTYPSDNNHPLYTFLAWLSVRALGESAFALRLPAALFGIGSIMLVYRLGTRLLEPRQALAAAAVLALSSHHVWFSQNARGYTGLLFLTLASTLGFLSARHEGSKRGMMIQAVALAAATYVHVTAVFLAMAQLAIGAAALRGRRGDRRALLPLAGVLVATVLSLMLHAPMLSDMVRFFLEREPTIVAPAAWSSPLWTVTEMARSFGIGTAAGFLLLAGGLVLVGSGLVSTWRRSRELVLMLILPGVFGALTMMAMGRNLWPRFFFFVAGFAVLVLAQGATAVISACFTRFGRHLEQRVFWPACVAVLVGATMLLPRAYVPPKQDFDGALEWIRQTAATRSVYTAGLATFVYQRYHQAGFRTVSTGDLEALERREATTAGAWVVYTLPIHLQGWEPDVWKWIETRTVEIMRFPGSVGGGDIVIADLVHR